MLCLCFISNLKIHRLCLTKKNEHDNINIYVKWYIKMIFLVTNPINKKEYGRNAHNRVGDRDNDNKHN